MEVSNSTQDPVTSILAVELSAMNLEGDRELYGRLPAGIPTPYQGTHRCWGIFLCHVCGHRWSSGSSWRDTFQRYNECDAEVYPKKQRRLRKKEMKDGPIHQEDKCGKCQEIGFSCRGLLHDGALASAIPVGILELETTITGLSDLRAFMARNTRSDDLHTTYDSEEDICDRKQNGYFDGADVRDDYDYKDVNRKSRKMKWRKVKKGPQQSWDDGLGDEW